MTVKSAFKVPGPLIVKLLTPPMVDAALTVKLFPTLIAATLAFKTPPLMVSGPVPRAELVLKDKVPVPAPLESSVPPL